MLAKRIRASVYGLAVGDVFGGPFEFRDRKISKEEIIHQKNTLFSDDTSMMLAVLDSLSNGWSLKDMMNRFVEWFDQGSYTQRKKAFGYGRTTRLAIERYKNGKDPHTCGLQGFKDNGNGALMRLVPSIFYLKVVTSYEQAMRRVRDLTKLTHAHPISVHSSVYLMTIAWNILDGNNLIKSIDKASVTLPSLEVFGRLRQTNINDRKSVCSTGYVIDTLESTVEVLRDTNSYQEVIIQAIQKGGDTDTLAAICGSLAGIYYGEKSIPKKWIQQIENRSIIDHVVAYHVWSLNEKGCYH